MNATTKFSYICVITIAFSCILLPITSSESDENNESNQPPPVDLAKDNAPSDEFEEVTLEQGTIRGYFDKSSKGIGFYSFLGIPYAKPPVGDLRFKDPEMADGWKGVRDGTIPPPICSQIDLEGLIAQPTAPYKGEEDCLYLNIYTPEPNFDYSELPVLVFIHGGQFVSGGANDYEPYDFMNVPAVLVVIQYRLGVLGFLSTEDMVMPGNLGLKDQTLALKWIHKNIEKFGGSPVKITLFGSGSGAASVHYQTLSHRTIGLFKRAILQSGNALCPWASGAVHKEAAYHLGKHFKCLPEDVEEKDDEQENEAKTDDDSQPIDDNSSKDNENTENNNENESVEKIESAQVENESEGQIDENENDTEKPNDEENENLETNEKSLEKGDGKESIPEVIEKIKLELEKHGKTIEDTKEKKEIEKEPEIEKSEEEIKHEELLKCLQNVDVKELTSSVQLFYMWAYLPMIFGPRVDKRYLPETPEFLMKNGRHKRADLIIGINREDGADLTNSVYLSEGRRMALKHHFPLVGPVSLEFSDIDLAPINMTIKAYDKYAGGINIDAKDAYNLTKMYTDRHFGVCSDLAAEFHVVNNQRYKRNVYFYELNHRGQRSTGDTFELNFGKEWISLGDELFYLFPKNTSKTHVRDEEDERMRDLMVKMWLLFADSGNPTPNNTFDFTWEPYTLESRKHLSLTTNPIMEDDNRKEAREFWTSLPTSQNIYFYKEYFEKVLNIEKVKEELLNEASKEETNKGDEKNEDVKLNKNVKVEL